MGAASEHLNGLGISMEDAYEYIMGHLDSPDVIFKTADKYNVTTQMLAEIAGEGIESDDVIGYFEGHGYDSDVLDLSIAEYLAQNGQTIEKMYQTIKANVTSPKILFQLAQQYGLTTEMLAEILEEDHIDAEDIAEYFLGHGYDSDELEDGHDGSEEEDEDSDDDCNDDSMDSSPDVGPVILGVSGTTDDTPLF